MTWTASTSELVNVCEQFMLWVQTVRATAFRENGNYGPDWWPTNADIWKSALFERIRAGKAPLPHPPPLGLSCPWYAIVEAPQPHYIGDHDNIGVAPEDGLNYCQVDFMSNRSADYLGQRIVKTVSGPDAEGIYILQHLYIVTETISKTEYIIKDYRDTPYRFRLWFNPNYKRNRPGYSVVNGGWFLQNTDFEKPDILENDKY